MFCDSNNFKPTASHFFEVKELPIEVRRKNWRQKELNRRRKIFSSSIFISFLFARVYNLYKNNRFY